MQLPSDLLHAIETVLEGMIWHVAVHPDYQRSGIGGQLLGEVRRRAATLEIRCLEAWTRDDVGALRWYESHGFEWVKSYLHVYLQRSAEVDLAIKSDIPNLRPVAVFAHYSGTDRDSICAQFERVHVCNCFRLWF